MNKTIKAQKRMVREILGNTNTRELAIENIILALDICYLEGQKVVLQEMVEKKENKLK